MNKLHILLLSIFASCQLPDSNAVVYSQTDSSAVGYHSTGEIKTPAGFTRVPAPVESFTLWLRNIPVKKDPRVFLYNGELKRNQSAQFCVLDIPVGKKDLQQCADAVMRLRAEYLYTAKRFAEIRFTDNNGKAYSWNGENNRPAFEQYLEKVFGWCGSASLEKQLTPVEDLRDMQPGDVFIKGGFPGHAMIVIDVAVNKSGKKIFMLAQSYMPAQDIHIVRNPSDRALSPWYDADDTNEILTPEWDFTTKQLRRW